jgi:hypothetical protein
MKTHHKWLLAIAIAISVAAWLAWTMLSAESDLAPQGRLTVPAAQRARGNPSLPPVGRVEGA